MEVVFVPVRGSRVGPVPSSYMASRDLNLVRLHPTDHCSGSLFQESMTSNDAISELRIERKRYLIYFGCFLVGLFLGVIGATRFATTYWGSQLTSGLAMINDKVILEAEKRAFVAYQHEIPPVAKYALSEYLTALKAAALEVDQSPGLLTQKSINADLMFTHARLANICTKMGESKLASEHVAEALRYASTDVDFSSITNTTSLFDILSKTDETVAGR